MVVTRGQGAGVGRGDVAVHKVQSWSYNMNTFWGSDVQREDHS